MIGFPIGMLYSNAGEWFIHKYVLHNIGKNKKSFWSFHWHEHHREARRNDHVDPNYKRSIFGWNPQSKELVGIVGLGLVHAPLLPIAPFFTLAVWYSGYHYYKVHKKAHTDPEWARKHLPWHVDHHMGPDQNQNWCVSYPWFDHIMGTRHPYVMTPQEKRRPVRVPVPAAQAA